jgi:hypothetical protein
MSIHLQDAGVWRFASPVGELSCGSLAARVSAAEPQLGLHGLCIADHPAVGQLFAVLPGAQAAWTAPLVDAYVRGADLVAAYGPASDWPYRPQIYWSAEALAASGGPLANLSVLVSIQTDLLDTHPLVYVATELPAEEVLTLNIDGGDVGLPAVNGPVHVIRSSTSIAGAVWRLPGGRLSYVELAEPNDFRRLSIRRGDGRWRSEWELFAEFLEKGVIRRARLHGAFLTRERDVELATALANQISSRPLPLTT